MRYSFDDPSAPSARRTQFYSMLGSRAIWHDGWKAVTTHPTISGWSHFNDDTWELYHTDTDRAELHDLAAERPDRLRELISLRFAEAGANGAEQMVAATEDAPAGENLILSASFDKDGEDPPGVATGVLALYHGDRGEPYVDLEREAEAMLARE